MHTALRTHPHQSFYTFFGCWGAFADAGSFFCDHGNIIHNNHNAHAHSLTHAPAPIVLHFLVAGMHLLMRGQHSLAHASTPIILHFLVAGVHLPMRDHFFCDHGNIIHNNRNAHA